MLGVRREDGGKRRGLGRASTLDNLMVQETLGPASCEDWCVWWGRGGSLGGWRASPTFISDLWQRRSVAAMFFVSVRVFIFELQPARIF